VVVLGGELHGGDGMRVYRFTSYGRVALTADHSGANLPSDQMDRWVFEGTTDIREPASPRIGAVSAAVAAAIRQDGYFVWPVTVIP
jgi:hypothetical protein